MQLHQQVEPDRFATLWNAAQSIAGVQLAIGANSPFFFGRELWRETRIALFEQATDTRPEELKAQGVRPRVWFGERWITSIFDLFEENVRYFPALLPGVRGGGPGRGARARRRAASWAELRLHNGTVYRWNRPVYDVVRGKPHLRVENRVLPAGPTVDRHARQRRLLLRPGPHADRRGAADLVAHVLLGGGGELPRRGARRHRRAGLLARRRRGPRRRARAAAAAPARPRGPGPLGGRRRPTATGCSASSSSAASTQRNGATWQTETFHRLYDERGMDRGDALREMTVRYRELMHANEPVATWPAL